jgi:hypothetical protein
MEYESLYGPAAVNDVGCAVYPTLVSEDMVDAGFVPPGDDSAGPTVIRQHLAWLDELGVDAITVDLTNDAPCTYDAEDAGAASYSNLDPTCTAAAQAGFQAIKDNAVHLYAGLSNASPPTRIKLIPMLDAQSANLLWKDATGNTALEHQVELYRALLAEYPDLSIVYEGRPLLILFTGPTPCIEGFRRPAPRG